MDGDGFDANREWEEATQEQTTPNPAGNMVSMSQMIGKAYLLSF
jgi:hypothetical protein